MFTIYRLNADELDAGFLESLKAAFPHKEIEIAVAEAYETAYLLRSPANRESLLAAVADVEAGRHIVEPDQTPFRCGRYIFTGMRLRTSPAGRRLTRPFSNV